LAPQARPYARTAHAWCAGRSRPILSQRLSIPGTDGPGRALPAVRMRKTDALLLMILAMTASILGR